jgi:FkbM family methyltransferase
MNLKRTIQGAARGMGYALRDARYLPKSHERRIYDYYIQGADGIQLIFDVGANIGQTVLAFQESFPGVPIHSFEPFGETFQDLVANTAKIPNVRCVQVALGEVDTNMNALSRTDGRSVVNSLLEDKQREFAEMEGARTETILLRRGDTYCAENGITRIDILKIDTEGFEIPVLNGFGNLLDTGVGSVLCEFCLLENNSGQTPLVKLHELLHPRGFELVSVYDLRYEADGAFHYGNALFVHERDLRSDRRW